MLAHEDPAAIAGAIMVVAFFAMVAFLGWAAAKYGEKCPHCEKLEAKAATHRPPEPSNGTPDPDPGSTTTQQQQQTTRRSTTFP